MWGMATLAIIPLFASEALYSCALVAILLVFALLGGAIGGSLSKRPTVGAVAGLFMGMALPVLLFWVVFFLIGWWPFSDGP
jgi:hypothetical protein